MKPPKWANRFLEWYCRTDKIEGIQGDLYELFERRASERPKLAKWQFAWDVVRFFRPNNLRFFRQNQNSPYQMMLRSYITAGFRNATKNGATSLINVFGLAIGVAIAVTAFIFMDFMWHVDHFHANKDRVYEVISELKEQSRSSLQGDSPRLLGPSLAQNNPSIEATARVKFGRAAVRYKDIVFSESIWFVDPAFQNMFSFPVVAGTPGSLKDKQSVVINDAIAAKYFGDTNAIGQTMSMKFPDGSRHEFTVGNVVHMPDNAGMSFDILVSMEKWNELEPQSVESWKSLVDATFVMFYPGHSPNELIGLGEYVKHYNSSSDNATIERFQFIALDKLSSYSNRIVGAISYAADPKGVWSLGCIALGLLLLACFNYMNVAVATVSTRLKEIGIRKVIGSRRKEIIQQFLTENILICAFAVGVGTLLSYTLVTPGLNSLFPFDLPFAFSSGTTVFVFFFGLLIFIGLVSGTYPAFYVSSFKPITILRGREKFGQRGLFSRILLTIQFVLAFTMIVGSFVFIDNAWFQQNKDWGYGHDRQMVVPVDNKQQFLAMRDKIATSQMIESYAGSQNAVGYDHSSVFIEDSEKKKFEAVQIFAGDNYMETMNFRMKEGRLFDKKIESDNREAVIVNEVFAKRMNWQNALNASFELDSTRYYVIGVVEDFHYDGFYNVTLPVVFRVVAEDNYRYLSVRVRPGTMAEVDDLLRKSWREVAADDPYKGYIQDSVFEDFHRDNNANIKMLIFFSSTAVTLACLGLFGLVSYNITRRMKEFSIRKVFGASVSQIFRLMNRDYVVLLTVAFLLGAPAGFFLINALIQQIYPEPQAPSPIPFLIAVALMVMTVGITIGSQMRRIVKERVGESLRVE